MPVSLEDPTTTRTKRPARTARVAVIRTRLETVLQGYARVMDLSGYRDTISQDRDTLIKLNLTT